jgi:hypothetical protein
MDSYFIKFRTDGEKLWTWRKVDMWETFGSLKAKALSAGSLKPKLDSCTDACLYTIKIHYLSLLRTSKLPLEPSDGDYVLPVLHREETRWPGVVVVSFDDRRVEFPQYLEYTTYELINRPWQRVYERGKAATEWIPLNVHQTIAARQNQTLELLPAIWENIFNELCESSVFHGALQRKIMIEGRTEVWRDEYVIFQTGAIWCANMKFWEDEKQFCKINTDESCKAAISNGGMFSVSCSNYDEKEIHFKCKSTEMASSWVFSFNSRGTGCNGNTLLHSLENSIADSECEASLEEFHMLDARRSRSLSPSVNFDVTTKRIPVNFGSVLPLVQSANFSDRSTTVFAACPLYDTHIAPCSVSVSSLHLEDQLMKIIHHGLLRCCFRVKHSTKSMFFSRGNVADSGLSGSSIESPPDELSTASFMTSKESPFRVLSKESTMSIPSPISPLAGATPSADEASMIDASQQQPYALSRFRSPNFNSFNMYEDFAKFQQSESVHDGLVQMVAVIEAYGVGKLFLYDSTASHFPNASIDLHLVKQVSPIKNDTTRC